MIRPSVDDILAVMRRKGYRVFDTPRKNWNLNIVGIRSFNPVPREFDDTLGVFCRVQNDWSMHLWTVTTDPGLFYLRTPLANRRGTAILKEGQYRGAYRIDIHARGRSGAHKALCQRLGPVTVFRDANRDDRLNLVEGKEERGIFGINIHRACAQTTPLFNWKASAGCQVFPDRNQFDDFMTLCEHAKEEFGDKFTYTLLHERDF